MKNWSKIVLQIINVKAPAEMGTKRTQVDMLGEADNRIMCKAKNTALQSTIDRDFYRLAPQNRATRLICRLEFSEPEAENSFIFS